MAGSGSHRLNCHVFSAGDVAPHGNVGLDDERSFAYVCMDMQMKKGSSIPKSGSCNRLSVLLSPKLFKALSDTKRVSLLVRLAEGREPRTVSHLAEGSGIDISVVSRHLAALREAGIINCMKQGKEVWCVINKGAVVRMLRELADALDACCPDEPTGNILPGHQSRAPSRKARRSLVRSG